MFLSNVANPSLPPVSEYRETVLDPIIKKTGKAPLSVFQDWLTMYGQKELTPYPRPFQGLGISVYLQCTSPLRRFHDMVCHWQVEAALLHEASVPKGVHTPVGSTLPFDVPQLQEMCAHHQVLQDVQRKCSMSEQRHWSTQLLFRKFYFQEGEPLPETFTIHVRSQRADANGECAGVIEELHLFATVVENKISKRAGGLECDSRWKVRVSYIETNAARIYLEPIAKIS